MSKKKSGKKNENLLRYSFYVLTLVFLYVLVYYSYLYGIGAVSLDFANAITSMAFSMLFMFAVFSYLFVKGKKLKEIIRSLGLSRDKLNTKAITIGLKLFGIIFILEIATSLISQATGVQIPTNVSQVLGNEPIYFLLFAAFISPINEEIFFRGFLVPRIGIIFSAIIFAVLHAGYASLSEFVAALIFGILAGYYFKKYGSLYSTILAHFLVNFLTIMVLIFLGAGAV